MCIIVKLSDWYNVSIKLVIFQELVHKYAGIDQNINTLNIKDKYNIKGLPVPSFYYFDMVRYQWPSLSKCIIYLRQ